MEGRCLCMGKIITNVFLSQSIIDNICLVIKEGDKKMEEIQKKKKIEDTGFLFKCLLWIKKLLEISLRLHKKREKSHGEANK